MTTTSLVDQNILKNEDQHSKGIDLEYLTEEQLKETLSEVFERRATGNYDKEWTYDIKVEVISGNFNTFFRSNCFDYSDKVVAYGLLTYQIMHYPFNETNKYENAVIALNTATKLFGGKSNLKLERGFTNIVFDDYKDEMDQMLAYMDFFQEAFLKQEESKEKKQSAKSKKKNKGGNKYE